METKKGGYLSVDKEVFRKQLQMPEGVTITKIMDNGSDHVLVFVEGAAAGMPEIPIDMAWPRLIFTAEQKVWEAKFHIRLEGDEVLLP